MAYTPRVPDLPQMNDALFESIARRFRLLGDPVRLKILHRLNQEPTSVGELARMTNTSQPNVSKHLAILRDGGVVTKNRVGSTSRYEISDPTVFDLCQHVCSSIEAQVESQRALFTGQ